MCRVTTQCEIGRYMRFLFTQILFSFQKTSVCARNLNIHVHIRTIKNM